MNYLQSLGPLAIASRFKSLSDIFMRDMIRIYQKQNVDFEPRWFTFLHLIYFQGPLSITQIARQLNQSHPSSNQVANVLEKKGYVVSYKDKKDQRKRIIKLTEAGTQLINQLKPTWDAVEKAVESLLQESAPDLLNKLNQLEEHLMQEPMERRINRQLHPDSQSIRIINYHPRLSQSFRTLNERWLIEFFEVEPEDERLLNHPDEEIINKEGIILFACVSEQVAGTCALLKVNDTTCELTKMAVAPEFQGRQIGRTLLKSILKEAKARSYQKVILLTSEVLDKALSLYTSEGFTKSKNESILEHKLKRCSIQLELNLTTT